MDGIASVQAKTKRLERERPYVHYISDYMAANTRNTQNKKEKYRRRNNKTTGEKNVIK